MMLLNFTISHLWHQLQSLYEGFIFYYAAAIMSLYVILAIFSALAIRQFKRRNSFVDYKSILNSPHAPGISVIAPAYNEGATIIDNVHSLLTLNYAKFEVIIVNDGSTDDTLGKLIREFELVPVKFDYQERIVTRPVKRVFRSTNPAYSKLIVVDKENGKSKADASNAGINVASYPLFLCTDVDCIIEKNTLLHMVKPFLEEKIRVIAVGATIRIANSCEVDQGVLLRVIPPKKLLPRFQELEYIRSFLLGRMAWSQMNGLIIVSGGLGLFDKEIVINAGGYDHTSFAKDMEMITRMRRYMEENKLPYRVRYIPNSQCWTEGPATLKVFSKQRTRWARGLIQCLHVHRRVIGNPKYGIMGLLTYPYMVLFEWMAPFLELTGLIFYLVSGLSGTINWTHALILLLYVYSFSVAITTIAVLWDQLTFKYYDSVWQVMGLCLMAIVEPILYHPLNVFFSIRGNYFYFTGKKLAWGNMSRQGFARRQAAPVQPSEASS